MRAHAVIALSKLVGTDDEEDLEDGEHTILQTLLDVVAHDPAAYVLYISAYRRVLSHTPQRSPEGRTYQRPAHTQYHRRNSE